jgi:hypothetical protein
MGEARLADPTAAGERQHPRFAEERSDLGYLTLTPDEAGDRVRQVV